MIKIAILGADGGTRGGHALGICKILSSGIYDVEITSIYGDDKKEAEQLAEEFNIGYIGDSPEELVDRADAAFILPRHGDKHKAFAMPFILAGKPVFIDKPFTCSVDDAEEIIAAAEKSGSIICGGTYVKLTPGIKRLAWTLPEKEIIQSGVVAYPVVLNSPYGGYHFYFHHLIEVMLTVFGKDVKSVVAMETNGAPAAIANYGDFPVLMNFASNEGAAYAAVYYSHDMYCEKKIDYDGIEELQCNNFIRAIRTGVGDDPEHYLAAVKICNALIKSLETKQQVTL